MYIFVFVWYHPAKKETYRPRLLAHRGLFSASLNIVENSLDAFKRAKEHSYGVELDVQLTTDDRLVVFHDASLLRLCQVDKKVQDVTYDELSVLKLNKTDASICLFEDVCALDLPYLMVEIKTTSRRKETIQAVLNALKHYQGAYSLCSFDPLIVLEIKRQAPFVERGLIMESYLNNKHLPWHQRIILEFALLSGFIRPHYISFDIRHNGVLRQLYRLMRWPSAVWTVRDQNYEVLMKHHQTLIFEEAVTS